MARCSRNYWVSARTPPCNTILLALGSWAKSQPKAWLTPPLALAVVSLPSVFMVSLLDSEYPAMGLRQVLLDAHAIMDQRNRGELCPLSHPSGPPCFIQS